MSFHSWTDDDHLRAPVFLRLRDDVDPKSGASREARRRHAGHRHRVDHRRPDRRDRRAARKPQGGDDARGGTAPDPPHESRSRLLAGESGAEAAGAHQARSPALLRASLAVHAAASCRSPAHDDPHAGRHPRAAIFPEALGAGASRVRRVDHRVLGPQGRAARVSAVQQPADAPVARAVRHARVSRLAFARQMGARRALEEHRLRELARLARSLGAQLSRLRAVRHRSLHLFRQGSRRRGAGAQHRRLREGQGSGVLAARAPAEHVARGHRQDVGQDRACTSSCRSGARSTSMRRATSPSSSDGT